MAPSLVSVAVPIPLPEPLTYRIPPGWESRTRPGVRVRVRVGKRRLVGVVVGLPETAPEGVELRELEGLVDLSPVLPPELLELARFTSEYYLAPLGEVLRSFVPGGLPPWGDRVLWLTDQGALASPRDAIEGEVVRLLLEERKLTLGELERRLGGASPAPVVERMLTEGRLRDASPRAARGSRYVRAVEPAFGVREELLARCGRSPKGRAVVDFLLSLRRPATVSEVVSAVGCREGVVSRLVARHALREYTQVEHLSLDRHVMGAAGPSAITLREDQQQAAEAICGAVARAEFSPFLLRGMTGSGKTEVYLRGLQACLDAGRAAILLVPEIGLVPALAGELRRRWPEELAILHSNLGAAERTQEWERIRRGEARVVLGPRSALFAPVASLGLVVVDEEHDEAYKQDVSPRYHGRDLALVRARREGATAVLVSATPSLESRLNVERAKLAPLVLTSRVGQGSLPEGILVDLRDEPREARKPGEIVLSGRLRGEIETTLSRGRQVILLRNRRGYAPLLLCRACGEDMRCDACGLPRTLHRKDQRLLCHYCGSRRPVPRECPSCRESALEAIGSGTERVEETFRAEFPGVAVEVLDRDAARRMGGAPAILQRFADEETQVLIGTQMVSKGHHFPGVELTAVLSADTYLGFPDFRAVEKTYSLLTQLAGRAGRGEHPGRVVIQSYHPEHYAIRAALRHDDQGFAREEMRFRRVFRYPPYSRMVQLRWSDGNRDRGRREIDRIAEQLLGHRAAPHLRITGPAPAPLERLRGRWRFQLIVRGPSGRELRQALLEVLPPVLPSELVVDVDPQQLL